MNRHRSPVLALTVAACLAPGCRSADPVATPPSAPALADAPATPEPEVFVSAPDVPVASDPEDDATPLEAASDPEAAQQEALELCQTAEAFLDLGDTDEALAALDRAYELMLGLPGNGDGAFLQARDDIRLLVADLIQRAYQGDRAAAAAPMTSWDLSIPIIENDHVQREIKSLTTVEREQFLAGYRRSGAYRPMILEKLEEAGLPAQVSWLPLVESWFKTRALSRASALGMWQFISSTGLRYGLSRDDFVDERMDPEKSTDAAIAYLTELHGMFGDWPKALAAYNCGEARVMRLQRRSEEYLDFWDLYAALPGETRRYVPRLFAAIQIIENPDRYGIVLPEPDAPMEVARIDVERPVKLEALDQALGLEGGTLAELNPELRHKSTPEKAYALRVPAGSASDAAQRVAALPKWKPETPQYVTHVVRRGESLSVIAGRYRSSVSAIMRASGLRSAHRIWPGQRLRIPTSRGYVAASSGPVHPESGVHTVRPGESLSIIARRHGTSVEKIKADNGLHTDMIRVGQDLRVADAGAGGGGGAAAGGRSYRVVSGDTLGNIASAHRVSLSALLRANGLSTRSTIYPGQTLVIPE